MDMRDVMTRDFDVVDAGWSLERIRAAVDKIPCPWIIVRRGDVGISRIYYVFRRDEIVNRLKAARGAAVRQALDLHEGGAAPTTYLDAPLRPSNVPQVVLGPQGPLGIVGILTSPRRTRSGSRSTNGTKGEPTRRAPVTRNLVADLPANIAAGETASLLVSLATVAPPGRGSAPFAKPVGTRIDVVVKPSEGLALIGRGERALEVSEPQSELPIQFKLRAEKTGIASVQIYAFCDGAAVAAFPVSTSIVAAGATPVPSKDKREAASIEAAPRQSPDLSMFVFEQGNELTFRLHSADGRFHMNEFGPIRLTGKPREHFRAFFQDIENLPLDTAQQRKLAEQKLVAKGASLFDAVFPADLKVLLWDLRDRIKTVQITSDEPWIPWEVCKLTGEKDGRVEEGPFFAEAFCVTRWLYGVSAAPALRLANLALVVPGDSQLPHAPQEKSYVMSLANAQRKVTEVPANYLDVKDHIAKGVYDAWHFTGHARANPMNDANLSAIELSNREELTPEDVVGRVENVLLTRPFIFLNACQSAQAGLSLTGVGGWAKRFLKSRASQRAASAFVGSYWSVFDAPALGFAKALYGGLLVGKPIGEASREARLAIRVHEDPTWLAYTIYADPHAKVERVSRSRLRGSPSR